MAEAKNSADKICGVCGDKALGCNFSAITCESCKAFFRRNALKRKEFTCPFNEECNVDVITRRFCQKCRLRKCFEIGMKKEWIMSEEQKKTKRAKIENNRVKRKGNHLRDGKSRTFSNNANRSPCSSPLSPIWFLNEKSDSCLPQAKITSINHSLLLGSEDGLLKAKVEKNEGKVNNKSTTENGINEADDDCLLSNNIHSEYIDNNTCIQPNILEENYKQFEDCSSHLMEQMPVFKSSEIGNIPANLKDLDQQECLMAKGEPVTECNIIGSSSTFSDSHQIVSSLLLEKDELFLPGPSGIQISLSKPVTKTNSNTVELGELENNKLQELLVANEVLKMPLSSWISDPSLLDVINMTDLAIRRLIKMSKRISGFRVLCQNDQIALLKGASAELMILRSVMSYDSEKECWKGPGGPKMSIKVDVLKEAKGNVYEEHKRFINLFHPSWRNDETIMLLLSAITLFTPDRPSTIHKDVIHMEQAIYQYLLSKYLKTIYSETEANICYQKLVDIIKELRILNDDHVQVYLNVDPKDVAPLLIEIFDLKH